MRTAVIIPCYNEAATIASVVEAVAPFGTPVVVDDAGTDGGAELAARAGAVVVRHESNRGYDGALQSGFERAAALGVEAVATIDADGQLDPDLLCRLLEPIEAGRAALVIGVRPRAARVSEAAFNLYARLRFGVADILCGQKAYRMDLFREHGRFDGVRSIGTELALWALRRGAAWTTVPVPVRPRQGASRMGSLLRAEARIFRALGKALAADVRGGCWA